MLFHIGWSTGDDGFAEAWVNEEPLTPKGRYVGRLVGKLMVKSWRICMYVCMYVCHVCQVCYVCIVYICMYVCVCVMYVCHHVCIVCVPCMSCTYVCRRRDGSDIVLQLHRLSEAGYVPGAHY